MLDTTLLHLLAGLALVVLAVLLATRYARRRYALVRPVDEQHFVECDDGFRLALSRYRAAEGAADTPPALLCHGFGANAYSLDLDAERSLARYLNARGRDVWILELRGIGASRATGDWRRRTWSFDDFVARDAPAAIAHVQAVTGAEQIHWVGHSMGGMIAYALLQGPHAAAIRSCTAIASPGWLGHVARWRPLVRILRSRHRPVRQMSLAHFGALFAGWAPMGPLKKLANPLNLGRAARRHALANLVAEMAGGVVAQFAGWIVEGRIGPGEGGPEYDFEEGLGRITTPIQLFAGTGDALVPPASVEHVRDRLGAEDTRYLLLGKAAGTGQEEYGHGDITIGDRVQDEVFPHVAEWLEAHDE